MVIEQLALLFRGERRVRRVRDAGLDGNVVDALGDLLGRRIVGQALAGCVEVLRLGHLAGRIRHQHVRALEVCSRRAARRSVRYVDSGLAYDAVGSM